VHAKADGYSQLNLPHGTKTGKKLEDAARKY